MNKKLQDIFDKRLEEVEHKREAMVRSIELKSQEGLDFDTSD